MEEQREITVLVVDDHQMLRDHIRNIIDKQENQTVIGEASNGEEAINFVKENDPDVIVLDVNLPDMDGIKVTKKITSIIPQAVVIGLSLHKSQNMVERMLRAGASAYIGKDKVFENLTNTIQEEMDI